MTYGVFDWDGGSAHRLALRLYRRGRLRDPGRRPTEAGALWDRLTADERVKPIGLGARDSLRLEAGLPLNGHDLDATTSPVEADLAFAVSKRRREARRFSRRRRASCANSPRARRAAASASGRPARRRPARAPRSATCEGRPVGVVTSGGFGPTVDGPIAMGYVAAGAAEPGTPVNLMVRGKRVAATVVAAALRSPPLLPQTRSD